MFPCSHASSQSNLSQKNWVHLPSLLGGLDWLHLYHQLCLPYSQSNVTLFSAKFELLYHERADDKTKTMTMCVPSEWTADCSSAQVANIYPLFARLSLEWKEQGRWYLVYHTTPVLPIQWYIIHTGSTICISYSHVHFGINLAAYASFLRPVSIWLDMDSQNTTFCNILGKICGDSGLSEKWKEY